MDPLFSVCACREIKAPRTSDKYREHLQLALDEMELQKDHICCILTDHESAVRSAARDFGTNSLGCACHALQLQMKHGLPPIRSRAAASASSGSSSSSSSSSSSFSSSSSPVRTDDSIGEESEEAREMVCAQSG